MPASRKSSRPATERIIAAAIALFSRKGFNGTTTRMIATKARVNEAIIFRHFPTKRDLYAAIIQRKMTSGLAPASLDLQTLEGEGMDAILRLLAGRILDSVESDPDFIRLLYFSGLEGHALSTMFFETYVARVNEVLMACIERDIAQGRMQKIDPYLAVRAFIGMIGHYALTRELFGTPKDVLPRSKVIETFIGIFLHGTAKQGVRA